MRLRCLLEFIPQYSELSSWRHTNLWFTTSWRQLFSSVTQGCAEVLSQGIARAREAEVAAT
jgi:hypothetical protein